MERMMPSPWEAQPGETRPFFDASFYAIGGVGFSPFVLSAAALPAVGGFWWLSLVAVPGCILYVAFVIHALRAALRGD